MIVKVQAPLVSDAAPGEPDILIYGLGRSHLRQVTLDSLPDWLQQALHDYPKVYAHADLHNGGWVFKKLADPQPW
jgi:hypothetical protein